MYSVVLVDDEALIRNGIERMVAWEEYGFKFVGQAADGELALPIIRENKPDIVITDIKMPFMDGLELSKIIKKELPDTMIIIISGFDEFDYAKQALSIGVNEYLLKPISKKQFIEVLINIKERLDEKNKKLEQFDAQMKEYLDASRSSLLDALLNGREPINKLIEKSRRLDLNLINESYSAIFLVIGKETSEQSEMMEYAEYQDMIYANFINKSYVCKVNSDSLTFLIMDTEDNIDDKTIELVNDIRAFCRKIKINGGYVIKYAQAQQSLEEIINSVREIKKSAYFDRMSVSIKPSMENIDFDPNSVSASQFAQQIIVKFLSSGLEENISAFVNEYFNAIDKQAANSLLFRQYIAIHVQLSVNAFLENIENMDKFRTNAPNIEELSTLEGTKEYMKKLFKYALDIRNKSSNGNNIVYKAIDYIKENFSDSDISLNKVAQFVGVRSTYFSAVFGQQIGKTFVEYLTELRMEKARTLLRCTDKPSGDIAFEVGYNDPHYFSSLFKKINGCSPRDYRAGKTV